jgi:hypothetical protein
VEQPIAMCCLELDQDKTRVPSFYLCRFLPCQFKKRAISLHLLTPSPLTPINIITASKRTRSPISFHGCADISTRVAFLSTVALGILTAPNQCPAVWYTYIVPCSRTIFSQLTPPSYRFHDVSLILQALWPLGASFHTRCLACLMPVSDNTHLSQPRRLCLPSPMHVRTVLIYDQSSNIVHCSSTMSSTEPFHP